MRLEGNRATITAGLMLGISLAALEATVVGTAMPTVVAMLGGLEHYSWVFSAYLLTSTASLPVWGRLSDLHGRRRVYLVGISLFLAGSALAGAARSMPQLVLFRLVQGLGAGALIPIALTIIGEIYTIEERARMQALFSGIWGVASIGGPLVGGWLTDSISWRWVFFINLPFGLASAAIIGLACPKGDTRHDVPVDWAGALLLFGAVSALLAGLSGVGGSTAAWMASALVLTGLLAVVERRAADPILPFALFGTRIVSTSLAIVFLLGFGMFGAIAFIPLLVQGSMGGSATDAGAVLTPLFLGWVVTSIISARLLLHVGYRSMTTLGIAMVAAAFGALAFIGPSTPRSHLLLVTLALGGGMGFSMLALLLAIQHGVVRPMLGLATSLNQFFRSVGSAIGVAMLGAILALELGGDAASLQIHAGHILGSDPDAAAHLASALNVVFAIGGVVAALALLPAALLPTVDFHAGVAERAGEKLIAAEMTSLEPENEPVGIRE